MLCKPCVECMPHISDYYCLLKILKTIYKSLSTSQYVMFCDCTVTTFKKKFKGYEYAVQPGTALGLFCLIL